MDIELKVLSTDISILRDTIAELSLQRYGH